MADEEERRLERAAADGDAEAAKRLKAIRKRRSLKAQVEALEGLAGDQMLGSGGIMARRERATGAIMARRQRGS